MVTCFLFIGTCVYGVMFSLWWHVLIVVTCSLYNDMFSHYGDMFFLWWHVFSYGNMFLSWHVLFMGTCSLIMVTFFLWWHLVSYGNMFYHDMFSLWGHVLSYGDMFSLWWHVLFMVTFSLIMVTCFLFMVRFSLFTITCSLMVKCSLYGDMFSLYGNMLSLWWHILFQVTCSLYGDKFSLMVTCSLFMVTCSFYGECSLMVTYCLLKLKRKIIILYLWHLRESALWLVELTDQRWSLNFLTIKRQRIFVGYILNKHEMQSLLQDISFCVRGRNQSTTICQMKLVIVASVQTDAEI